MAKDIHLIALCSIPALGPVTINRLLREFANPEAVFRAGTSALLRVEGISEKRAEAVVNYRGWEALEKDLARVEKDGARVVAHGSAGYPEWLRQLGDDAPPVLYIKGELSREDRFALAVVGSRAATPYGRGITEKISFELGKMGFTVVSGLARGIDTAAHRGCLEAGGRTVGVLGCGIDVTYPAENRWLYERAAESGAVISEFPPGTKPLPANFPRRNRILSGLTLGVLVVEAAEKSGSLITARYALEQGKEVFSIPGNISSSVSTGTNDLIKQGARMVTGAGDIVEELAPQLKGFIKSSKKELAGLTVEEQAICDIMSAEPRHIDELSREGGMPAPKALAVLLALELKGVVKQTEGKRFYLA